MGGCTQEEREGGKGTFLNPATALLLVHPSFSDTKGTRPLHSELSSRHKPPGLSEARGIRNTAKTKMRKNKSSEKEEERSR